MTEQLDQMRATVAAHKSRMAAMDAKVVKLDRRCRDGIETLWGVEVCGEVRVTFGSKPLADAFAAEIVRGEA